MPLRLHVWLLWSSARSPVSREPLHPRFTQPRRACCLFDRHVPAQLGCPRMAQTWSAGAARRQLQPSDPTPPLFPAPAPLAAVPSHCPPARLITCIYACAALPHTIQSRPAGKHAGSADSRGGLAALQRGAASSCLQPPRSDQGTATGRRRKGRSDHRGAWAPAGHTRCCTTQMPLEAAGRLSTDLGDLD